MTTTLAPASRLLRRAATALLLAGSALLTGCASFYVDTATRDIPAADYRKPAEPGPVLLSFEFQNNGTPNPQVTALLRSQVTEQVLASGLFSGIATDGKGASLIVSVNNLPVDIRSAATSGFVTGMTFGLAGNVVTDYYECKLTYRPDGQGAPVTSKARHAIHTKMGGAGAPAHAVRSVNVEDALRTMTRQIVSQALNDLSRQPALDQGP